MKRKVLLVPLDPVHDVGLKLIKRALDEAGHQVILLPPDEGIESIMQIANREGPEVILISRTIGYRVAEELSRFIDLAEATGLRKKTKLGIGGMAIKEELAAELGFDRGFGPNTTPAEAVAFVEGRPYQEEKEKLYKIKPLLTKEYDYQYFHQEIGGLLKAITGEILDWAHKKSSPAVERAIIRQEILESSEGERDNLLKEYLNYCDEYIKTFYQKGWIPRVKGVNPEQERSFHAFLEKYLAEEGEVKHHPSQPQVMVQYGTGCPILDIAHIRLAESWGADGVVHFDPAWGARQEGLLEGFLSHEESGTVITGINLKHIKASLLKSTSWQVRAHRGLNTPETVLLTGKIGGDLTKINVAYGSLGGGTDPERLLIDAIASLKYAAKYNLPFDLPTNEELSGVPSYKAMAGMLITSDLGIQLGAKPILQPLFCFSPYIIITGQMDQNYIDFNGAKIYALREIIHAPIWPGAPIGFMTHTEERVQSSTTTAFHAALAASLGVEAISIASSDEAYAGGPITAPSRVDTLRSVKEGFRFLGGNQILPGKIAHSWKDELIQGIIQVLQEVKEKGFLASLYEGVLGSREEGAYPGRHGKGSVFTWTN